MNDREALYQAILDNPEDDTLRLIYADWLEENGHQWRPEFIRIACKLAGNEDLRVDPHAHYKSLLRVGYDPKSPEMIKIQPPEMQWEEIKALKNRLFELWTQGASSDGDEEGDKNDPVYTDWEISLTDRDEKTLLVYRSGFISKVRLTMRQLLDHAKVLHPFPLREIQITDKKPTFHTRSIKDIEERTIGEETLAIWYIGGQERGTEDLSSLLLPFLLEDPRLRLHLSRFLGFETEEIALDALNRACLLWLRREREIIWSMDLFKGTNQQIEVQLLGQLGIPKELLEAGS